MSVRQENRPYKLAAEPLPTQRGTQAAPEHGATPTTARGALAVLRLAVGFTFLWPFLDKTFGLGYSTAAENSWINGGSPTKGFLSHVAAGPLQSTFHAMAGAAWADWLFMLGLLGVGVAVLLGVGLRVSAAAGSLIMVLMWFAEWPPAQQLSTGEPSGSTNPFLDYHLLYAIALTVLAATYAGQTWGLGRSWARLPLVSRQRWLI